MKQYIVKYVNIATSRTKTKEFDDLLSALEFLKKIREGKAQGFLYKKTRGDSLC